jgi:hypothetical protein
MFDQWRDFFLLMGSAAAVLIGLIFVVISLMHDHSRSHVLEGSKLYMGPIVLGMSFVLVLSAAAMTPGMDARIFAAVTAMVALWGLARGAMSFVGIARRERSEDRPHWTDKWFYGVVPAAFYLALAAVAAGFWRGCGWAYDGLAAVLTAGLLLAIRNEWDLITWLAPRGESDAPEH